jgi:hypothetical protein
MDPGRVVDDPEVEEALTGRLVLVKTTAEVVGSTLPELELERLDEAEPVLVVLIEDELLEVVRVGDVARVLVVLVDDELLDPEPPTGAFLGHV